MGVNQNLSFEVCADAYDTENDEINEDNNCGNITLVCEAYPDLWPFVGRPVDCKVNETNTMEFRTLSGNICTENVTWTNISFLDETRSVVISSQNFSIPPMPNLEDPRNYLGGRYWAPGDPPYPDGWGTCFDVSIGSPMPYYTKVSHYFEFVPPDYDYYWICINTDYGNSVDEGSFEANNRNCTFLDCTRAPGDITPFCEDIYLNGTGYNEEGVWGATNSGSDPVDVDFNVIGSGNVAPAPFDFWRTNITINGSSDYSELINWKCEADSWRSTYNVIVSSTDAIGDHSESVMCEVWCEVPLYCEDYL